MCHEKRYIDKAAVPNTSIALSRRCLLCKQEVCLKLKVRGFVTGVRVNMADVRAHTLSAWLRSNEGSYCRILARKKKPSRGIGR